MISAASSCQVNALILRRNKFSRTIASRTSSHCSQGCGHADEVALQQVGQRRGVQFKPAAVGIDRGGAVVQQAGRRGPDDDDLVLDFGKRYERCLARIAPDLRLDQLGYRVGAETVLAVKTEIQAAVGGEGDLLQFESRVGVQGHGQGEGRINALAAAREMPDAAVDVVSFGVCLHVAAAARCGAQQGQRQLHRPLADRQPRQRRRGRQGEPLHRDRAGAPLSAQEDQRQEYAPGPVHRGCQPIVLAVIEAGFAENQVDGYGLGAGRGKIVDGPRVQAARPGPGDIEFAAVKIDAPLVDLDQDDSGRGGRAEQADLLIVDLRLVQGGEKAAQGKGDGEDQRRRQPEALQFQRRGTERRNLAVRACLPSWPAPGVTLAET